jgi:FkbM family methyltransferase
MIRRVIRKIRVLWRVAVGRDFLVKPVARPKERFGSDSCGWYIMTTDIGRDSIIYSFGIGEDASFDTALAERFGLTVHAFDPTPRSIEWIKQQAFSDRFVLHECGLSSFDGTASFNPPENPDHVSHTLLNRPSTSDRAISVPVKKLATIMKELGHARIDVMKMDIEGAEYDVLEDISKCGIRPRQILVEFHHRFPDVGITKTKEAIRMIRSIGYQLFHVSDNHEEFGFALKKDVKP